MNYGIMDLEMTCDVLFVEVGRNIIVVVEEKSVVEENSSEEMPVPF